MTDERPRQIASEMQLEMRRAAGLVWKRYVNDIPDEDRKEWERLCKRHVALFFNREWGQG